MNDDQNEEDNEASGGRLNGEHQDGSSGHYGRRSAANRTLDRSTFVGQNADGTRRRSSRLRRAEDRIASPRPLKRRKTEAVDDASQNLSNTLIESLLDRLTSVKKSALTQRNRLLERAAELSDSVDAKRVAQQVAEKVSPPHFDDNVQRIAYGGHVRRKSLQETPSKPPTPAVAMLVKRDSLERSVYDQNIIERAKTINRKNSELARERLPKQPEAGKNKTHWDYFLDEATWMAQDVREERKYKLSQTRKLSKMVLQYHALKSSRARRAAQAEEIRRMRVANTIARDVKKFWSQVCDIVNYRLAQAKEKEDEKHKQKHLFALLEQTEEFSSALASHLQPSKKSINGDLSNGKPDGIYSNNTQGQNENTRGGSIDRESKSVLPEEEEEVEIHSESDGEQSEPPSEEEFADEDELAALRNEADAPLEDVLRDRGVDTTAYLEDVRDYGVSHSGSENGEDSLHLKATSAINDERSGTSLLKDLLKYDGTSLTPNKQKGGKEGDSADLLREESHEAEIKEGEKELESILEQCAEQGTRATENSSSVEQRNITTKDEAEVTGQGAMEVPTTLLRAQLRDYQKVGLEWLAALYEKKLNGILADEMGLGKTVQTIALLAWLAVKKGIWGPHLIIVPTSVVLNWEVEFKKFLPGFKILTYFGSIKERRAKRIGWTKPHNFHVCITSYTLVVQDASALKRKKWVYLILDEAHHIKNFQSQRWQTLLSFPSYRRLLLTGTPLQNSVMELWSLMHFLMPSIFASHSEFEGWFSSPLNKLVSGHENSHGSPDSSHVVSRLHSVLRPFLLRRLKKDVEKGLPPKSEHVVRCPLSKRQRHLYEDFMARSETQKTLASGDFFGVMNILMQLRKVCNHPDLFDGRPILSPFHMSSIQYPISSIVMDLVSDKKLTGVDISLLGLDFATMERDEWPGWWALKRTELLSAVPNFVEEARNMRAWVVGGSQASFAAQSAARRIADYRRRVLCHSAGINELRLRKRGLYGRDLLAKCMVDPQELIKGVKGMAERAQEGTAILEKYGHCVRQVEARLIKMLYKSQQVHESQERDSVRKFTEWKKQFSTLWRRAEVQSQISLPDTRLIQWDCGKLQVLSVLLRRLKNEGSRVLIFTQMSKVLDVLETFLNLHNHRYLRLDGATKVEARQKLTERFNQDTRVFCMILTTRSGGLGLNLTGADCVIFYDNDWNPAMDAQAQDRAHRIGQTKPVKIFRLVSSRTIEENILTKANQRRNLEALVISKAGFTTDSFRERINLRELITPLSSKKLAGKEYIADGMKGRGRASSREDSAVLHQNMSSIATKFRDPSGQDAPRPRRSSTENHLPVLSSFGVLAGPTVVPDQNENDATSTPRDSKSLEDEDGVQVENVDESLQATLMDDEERAGLYEMKLEEEMAAAEFEESPVGEQTDRDEEQKRRNLLEYGLYRSLRPVEKYALQLLEGYVDAGPRKDQGINEMDESLKKEFALSEMLKRRVREEQTREQELLNMTKSKEMQVGNHEIEYQNGSVNDDVDCYELNCSEIGKASYLKALAGADVHVKIYIGLCDGGPEELVVSTVVHGTTATGLECAEDAAFFPHAYNRMTRTAHATRRQLEKYLAKMTRRKADLARRNVLHSTAYDASRTIRCSSEHMNGIYDGHRASGTGMNGYISGPPLKRARIDDRSGPSFALSDKNGLFRRSSKKSSSRKTLMTPARSSSSGSDARRQIGLNDDWTVEQDRELIKYAAMYGNNMYVAADALRMHPGVAAGVRAKKNPQQCASRMLNVLTPKKSGNLTVLGGSQLQDLEILNKRMNGIIHAARILENRSLRPGEKPEPHATHVETEHAWASIGQSRFGPIPLDPAQPTSQHHRPGLKSIETTSFAVARKRRPFLRPLKEPRRIGTNRTGTNGSLGRGLRASSLTDLQKRGFTQPKVSGVGGAGGRSAKVSSLMKATAPVRSVMQGAGATVLSGSTNQPASKNNNVVSSGRLPTNINELTRAARGPRDSSGQERNLASSASSTTAAPVGMHVTQRTSNMQRPFTANSIAAAQQAAAQAETAQLAAARAAKIGKQVSGEK